MDISCIFISETKSKLKFKLMKIISQIEKRLQEIEIEMVKFNKEQSNGDYYNSSKNERLFQEQTILYSTIKQLKQI